MADEICCDIMERSVAFDRVWAFKSDHSGNFLSSELPRRVVGAGPSNELNELFLLGGDLSNELSRGR